MDRVERLAAGKAVPVEENRRVLGPEWMRWTPNERRRAWDHLALCLRNKLAASGMRLSSETTERIEVDEIDGVVWMLVEGEAVRQ